MMQNRIFFSTLFVLFFAFPAKNLANHIIGGVLTYECLSEGRYRFLLKVYRDCNCTNCADFDELAAIGVYRCTAGGTCNTQGQSEAYRTINVPIKNISAVGIPDYPCLVAPDVCVQEGVYEWIMDLPVSDISYHISYQRCCRNRTINNIIDPDDSGATYAVEITPEAQRLKNSSPIFNSFPPTVICADALLEYDHSAFDKDGDQLVYELCSPLIGGGPLLNAPFFATCQGAKPTPSCPPPYNEVRFRLPNYSALNPLGGGNVSIDPVTGLLRATPSLLGQFVVGVCIAEYRDGVLLSKIYRDFQFNVANCDPLVVADVKEDAVINGQEFLINSCGVNEVTFQNESYQRSVIKKFEWRFEVNGQTKIYTDWSPTVTFPGVGRYSGQLILNPETDCGDTAKISVNVFPQIEADFSYTYDTCVSGPVTFQDLSNTGADRITDWNWEFGDGNASKVQNPAHIYRQPGEIPVTLRVVDANSCPAAVTKPIGYYPAPAIIVVAPSTFNGCVPGDVFFDNLSYPIDETYGIFWDFGDGKNSSEISPNNLYENPGTYTVKVEITSPIGCTIDTTFNSLITIRPSPEAGFDYLPEEPTSIIPQVQIFDRSSNGVRWFYDFGNGSTTSERNPLHTYRDTGRYVITQIVTHPSGCQDTLQQIIDIQPEVRYFLPNAFTPNGDGVNDLYVGAGIMEGAIDFQLSVWNRWGELVFESFDPKEGWNGQKFNSGEVIQEGVYIVTVSYKDPRGTPVKLQGFATLIR